MKSLLKNNLIAVLALGAGAYGLYRILKPPPPEKKTQSQVNTEVQKEEQAGAQPTYSNSVYMAMADSLQAAMFDAGTDEGRIFGVIEKMKSKIDILKLISAFGIRTYRVFGWSQGEYNLGQWFTEELSASELSTVNGILATNKIPYQF